MQEALTYDDVTLVPQYSEILPGEAILETKLSRNLKLRLPFVSAPMDTVTEHRLAIALALEGGIGIIHKNSGIEKQCAEVRLVKRFENGFVLDPATVAPDDRIDAVYEIRTTRGYKKVPVVDKRGRLVGLITRLDYYWPEDKGKKVKNLMTPVAKLTIAKSGITLDAANRIIHQRKLSILPVIDKTGQLVALVTRKDLEKNVNFPRANKDEHKRLRVGGAVGVGQEGLRRAVELVRAGVDVLVVDTAHGHSAGVIATVKLLKKDKNTGHLDVIAGNIATAAAARDLIAAGADAVKVGMGPGSICTTRIVSGTGIPQITAIMDVLSGQGKGKPVPIIADGGVRYSGDIVKALAAGADCVMMGGLFAGAEESPGETEYYGGRVYKVYRGMGSLGAMKKGAAERYGQAQIHEETKLVPEGIEGRILYRGPADKIIYQLAGGLRSGMGYLGAKTIAELRKKAVFMRVTSAGGRESHPHDIEITKQAPNYQTNQ